MKHEHDLTISYAKIGDYFEEYWSMINNAAFLGLIWDCYAWAAWQYILVSDKNGEHKLIPDDFPSWKIA